ncbi:MAG: hypothetical protein JNK58_00305 [Phycisphaerae bacterium]|nr:hypothetical protein [Phycisphaerae bacterium]
MNWNWVKYAVLAIAPLVLIWGVYTFISSSGNPIPGALEYVDVMSGEVVNLNSNKIKSIPARNSKGERVLLPLERRDGRIYVQDRYKDALDSMKGDARLKVDIETLEVKGAK